MKEIYLYGTGGIAIVAVEAALCGDYRVAGFFDDSATMTEFLGHNVYPGVGSGAALQLAENSELLICLGHNPLRKKMFYSISHNPATVVHDTAVISPSAKLGEGTMIFHSVNIQAAATIGKSVIANTACSIDHHCNIGDFCHIAPHVTLCGNVTLGEGVDVGAGAVVLPNLTIGKGSIIGAGAVVRENIPEYSVAVGVPAKVIKKTVSAS